MSREALVLLVCCCDFRDGAERLISSKSLRNAVIRAFPGLFRILRMCAPRRAAAVVRPRGREKSADRRRRILISRLLIIRASVPRRKSPFPAYFKGFPAVSPLIPPYPTFLKYPVSPHLDQIDMMLNRDPEPERQKLVVQTFGHFEAFFNDKPLPWERAKAKELLAFLVDQRGASATNAEIALTLWEDDSKVRSVQTIISSLRKTLRRVGMGDVLVRARNRTSINVKKIKCDLYDYLAGDSLAINVYQGEYMSNYSWAEFTNASLYAEIFLKEDL